MSDRMTVHRDGKPIYDIIMEENYDRLGQEVAALSVRDRRLCVVTDSTVAELYSDTVIRQLQGGPSFCVPGGGGEQESGYRAGSV